VSWAHPTAAAAVDMTDVVHVEQGLHGRARERGPNEKGIAQLYTIDVRVQDTHGDFQVSRHGRTHRWMRRSSGVWNVTV